jgi:hypothetical protein
MDFFKTYHREGFQCFQRGIAFLLKIKKRFLVTLYFIKVIATRTTFARLAHYLHEFGEASHIFLKKGFV